VGKVEPPPNTSLKRKPCHSTPIATIRKIKMKVLIDGKEIKVLNDVKIIYEEDFYNKKEDDLVDSELHLTVNPKGVVFDVIQEGQVEHTCWYDSMDLGVRLLNLFEWQGPDYND
jgi:hypothetical protein